MTAPSAPTPPDGAECSTCHATDVPLSPAISFTWRVIPGVWSCTDARACLDRASAALDAATDARLAARQEPSR